MELTSKVSCLQSYKNFMCRYNFPYCDPETGEVKPICIQDCYNAYVECGNALDSCNDPTVYNNVGQNDGTCFFNTPITVI